MPGDASGRDEDSQVQCLWCLVFTICGVLVRGAHSLSCVWCLKSEVLAVYGAYNFWFLVFTVCVFSSVYSLWCLHFVGLTVCDVLCLQSVVLTVCAVSCAYSL